MTPKPPNGPTAFIPGSGGYHPPATPPSRTEDARAPYAPRAVARLTVRADGWVYLNAEAARLLPAAEFADLRAPIKERGDWYLDLRPGGLCKLLPVGTSGGLRFRALVRARAMLGCADNLILGLEATTNQLFRLYALSANK